jgi:hypothetical protein
MIIISAAGDRDDDRRLVIVMISELNFTVEEQKRRNGDSGPSGNSGPSGVVNDYSHKTRICQV